MVILGLPHGSLVVTLGEIRLTLALPGQILSVLKQVVDLPKAKKSGAPIVAMGTN